MNRKGLMVMQESCKQSVRTCLLFNFFVKKIFRNTIFNAFLSKVRTQKRLYSDFYPCSKLFVSCEIFVDFQTSQLLPNSTIVTRISLPSKWKGYFSDGQISNCEWKNLCQTVSSYPTSLLCEFSTPIFKRFQWWISYSLSDAITIQYICTDIGRLSLLSTLFFLASSELPTSQKAFLPSKFINILVQPF